MRFGENKKVKLSSVRWLLGKNGGVPSSGVQGHQDRGRHYQPYLLYPYLLAFHPASRTHSDGSFLSSMHFLLCTSSPEEGGIGSQTAGFLLVIFILFLFLFLFSFYYIMFFLFLRISATTCMLLALPIPSVKTGIRGEARRKSTNKKHRFPSEALAERESLPGSEMRSCLFALLRFLCAGLAAWRKGERNSPASIALSLSSQTRNYILNVSSSRAAVAAAG